MLAFASAYREAGVQPPRAEAPDHLPVVLEFAATVDPEVGRRLLIEHRVPIDVLRQGAGRRQVAVPARRGGGVRDAARRNRSGRAPRATAGEGRAPGGSRWAATVYLDRPAQAQRRRVTWSRST